ncbi:DUF1761 domain-containing protein [Polymorphospora rubra]|uniref:DUF1761 domain-containing protein n=1 Tax=Polymorphospora rubra TaxID=338584 RepID=A0A810ND72_9ACTN|nr:DUF1761 domain-containing protein [Polymorphospora rubra]BCJ70274.1 hypothetical protein Prubr_72950 [Polymorphospora rubra]
MPALAISAATVAALVISFAFYAIAPAGPAARTGPTEPAADRPAAWQIAVELLRGAVTAALVAGLLRAAGWNGPAAGALLGLVLWALPLVLLTGSVVWERVPVRSAVLHAGDWLIKLIAIGAIVGVLA